MNKKQYITVLRNTVTLVEEIFSIDENISIIDTNTKRYIYDLYKHCQEHLYKLENNILNLAIVGLENSGKSSFANALIEQEEVFPTDSSRCTFTSTKLVFGDDVATVEFYSKREFELIFQEMLEKINYVDTRVSFTNLKKDEFDVFLEQLNTSHPDIYEKYASNLGEDIKDIIDGQKTILEMLGNDPQEFDIKNSNSLREFITDKYVSRAVKNVVIESSRLSDMRHFVIYDVPGFDSTTEKHEQETFDKLKSADAIVVIKNVKDKPQVNSHELKILQKETSIDGIKLKDKLFVFGNQLDTCNTAKDAVANMNNLKRDFIKKFDLDSDRIFIGSALAYLQHLRIEKGDFAISGLEKLNLKNELNSIKDLHDSLESFGKKEALVNFQVKINNTLSQLKYIFESIEIKNNRYSEIEDFDYVSNKLFLNIIRNADRTIDDELANLDHDVHRDITEHGYFTSKLKDKIDKSFSNIDMSTLEKVSREINVTARKSESPNEINQETRNRLNIEFREKFKNIVVNIADEKAKEIENKIKNIFINSFGLKKNNPYYKEIEEATRKLIDNFTYEVSYNQKSFVHLIERFSRDLFDTLIKKPFATIDRKKAFLAAEDDFYSLAMYYYTIDNEPNFTQPLISIVLAHKGKELTYTQAKIESILRDFFESSDENFNSEYISETAKFIHSKKISVEQFINKLQDKMNGKDGDNSAIISFVDEISGGVGFRDKDTYIDNLLRGLQPAETLKDVLDEINTDIDFLRDLLKHAVIKAISLEVPFVSTINNQIRTLQDKKSSDEFIDFLAEYVKRIRFQEFEKSEKEKVVYQNRKRVVVAIQDLLQNLSSF
jgi:ribosome-binding ATPase YchF (GTP1/OBG family)